MISRRTVFVTSLLATAASFFTLGVIHARRGNAAVQEAYLGAVAA